MTTSKALGRSMLLASLVAISTLLSIEKKGNAMKSSPTNRMTELFETTKTICIGRFVLDVPAESEVIFGPARLPYLIELRSNAVSDFDEVIAGRLKEITLNDLPRARGPLIKPDSMFGKVINGAVNNQRIVFGASKGIGSFYSIESIQMVGHSLYVQSTMAYGDDYRESIAQLNAVAPLLQPRRDDEVPTVPGVCLEGAFINEPGTPIYEAVSLGVRLRKYPDVHLSLEMTKKFLKVEGDSLEARANEAEKDARRSGAGSWYDRVKVFRRGERKIGQWSGSEYLARKPAIGQVHDSHEFAYFSHGESGNPMVPALDIELDTGVKNNKVGGMQTSITDDEAIYLWDKITSSLRPRPTSGGHARK